MSQHIATKDQGKSLILSSVEYYRAKLSYEMGPYSLKALLDDKTNDTLHIVDVRSPEAYAEGHIPTAVNIPLQELPGKMSQLPKDKTIVTYCGSITCQMAPKAALELAQKGFKVVELHGGLKEWHAYGYPVESTD